jgi:carbon monoxide dehydrogenase subunit G
MRRTVGALLRKTRRSVAKGLARFAVVTVTLEAQVATADDEDILVRVQKNDSGFDVHAELTVTATPEQTWEVLVDYDRMAEILSNVDASRIVRREGNHLEVAQTSHLGFGPLKISLDNRRRVEMIPRREIRSHLIEGDVRASDFTTRLVREGMMTRVVWRGRIVPRPLSGLVITSDAVEGELRQLCRELRAEVRRRKTRPEPPACRLAEACE